MTYLGIIVASVFASNALVTYGLGAVPDERREQGDALASGIALVVVNALASAFLWVLRAFVLVPIGFGSLDVFFFVLLVVPPIKFISRGASISGKGFISRIGSRADELVVGSLVFGIALISSRKGYSLPEALIASAASGLGYWLAVVLLDAIRDRLDLSEVPAPIKGAPAMLISAGLMSLAFLGLDAALAKGLAG